MVAQQVLVLFVQVRILVVQQPTDKSLKRFPLGAFSFSGMPASAASECMKPTRLLSIYQFITMQIDNIIRQYVCDVPILLRIKFFIA